MTETLTILFCALLPAVLLIGYVRHRDRQRPEPMGRILQAVIYGVFSALLSVPLSMALEGYALSSDYGVLAMLPFVRGVFQAFVGAAIPEESVKLLFLYLLLRQCDDFDEAIDGIVYAVCVGMGFAAIENVFYLFSGDGDWRYTAIIRGTLAVPGHYIYAVLMGFFYALVHFHPRRFGHLRSLVWIAPVLAHGIYDAILMVGGEDELLSWLSIIPLIAFCVVMHRFCHKRLRYIEALDTDTHDLDTFCSAVAQEQYRQQHQAQEQHSTPTPPPLP